MTANRLAGRIPRTASEMSPRAIYITAALVISGLIAIVYGFHYRIAKKEEQKAAVTAQVTAADAATSNRMAVQGQAPGVTPASSLGASPASSAPPPAPTPSLVNSGLSQLSGAVKAVSQPFGPPVAQQLSPAQQPSYPSYQSQPDKDPIARMKADRAQRAYERRLAAIVAPTGENQNVPNALAQPADPLQASIAALKGLTPSNMIPAQTPTMNAPSFVRRDGDDDPNGQAEKLAFQKAQEGDYLKTTRMAPISPWVVERGEVIPAGLPSQIVSDLPGDLIAEVKRDIYDTPQHKYVLIPAGSLLAGEYNSGVTYGQKRVQVVWTYLRFPDGSYVDLDKFVGHSADGSTGLGDQVDNHIKRLIGGIAMSSLFAAGIQISQNHTNSGGSTLAYPSNTQIAASAAGQQAGQVGEQITSRNLQVQPTIKIRPGDVFYVSVMKSIIFPGPYKPLDLGGRK
jgi:type IV secretory pathway VirB10-like protein